MEVKPRGDWLVMRPMQAPDRLGGLHISDEQKSNIQARPLGVVESKGPEVPEDVKVGSVVLYNENKGWFAVPGLDTRMLRCVQWANCVGVVLEDRTATADEMKRANEARRREEEAAAGQARKAQLIQTNGIAGRIGG